MTPRRLGPMLLVGGTVLLGLSMVALLLTGGIGQVTLGGILLAISLVVLGIGGLLASVTGWLRGGMLRAGAGILSVGMISMAGFSVINMQLRSDPLESMPAIVLGGIAVVAIPVGGLLTLGGLVWQLVRRSPRTAL
jgi:hypothetical protein